MVAPEDIPPQQPVLIAGPTASGKSALALRIAETRGGLIINADALQVYSNWHVLTARPGTEDLNRAPHALYGHMSGLAEYSVGHWAREVTELLQGPHRPIIVGGTGLYFSALTEGLADIPPTPNAIRQQADALRADLGVVAMAEMLDPETRSRIDLQNPMRVQRAWEVQHSTGKSLAAWQDATPPPVLPLNQACPILINAPKEWLSPRIAQRFDMMLKQGALDEVKQNQTGWDPDRQSSKAIGAPELMAYLTGECSLRDATEAAIIATRQYAKRQRTWFRARMKGWQVLDGADL